jgi:hypothetical protein
MVKVCQGTPVDTDKVVNRWEKLDARLALANVTIYVARRTP